MPVLFAQRMSWIGLVAQLAERLLQVPEVHSSNLLLLKPSTIDMSGQPLYVYGSYINMSIFWIKIKF